MTGVSLRNHSLRYVGCFAQKMMGAEESQPYISEKIMGVLRGGTSLHFGENKGCFKRRLNLRFLRR